MPPSRKPYGPTKLPAEVQAIIYDNESWTFTPQVEQHDIERFEKLAAEAIHRTGRLLIATPAADLVPVLSPHVQRGKRYDEYLRLGIARMAARWADVYEVQAQGSEDNLPLYQVRERGCGPGGRANPKVRIFAGLSTNLSGKLRYLVGADLAEPNDWYDRISSHVL